MKRRSFLQSIGAGIAALFVPSVIVRAAEKYRATPQVPSSAPRQTVPPNGFQHAIYAGDICVWDNGAYRPARTADSETRVAIAVVVPDGKGGFLFMREGIFSVQVA